MTLRNVHSIMYEYNPKDRLKQIRGGMYLESFLLIVSIFCVHCRKQDPATLTDRQKRYYTERKEIYKGV